ncbi:hypothetical protein HOY80DRAFT_472627 [Tuber brumale]|nr:hypothetical protein HOY80DRAFT_472627 [Tuber brumale]
MGCFSKSEKRWTKHNTMRVLALLLLCALVMIGVATAETVRAMSPLAIIALSLSLIGALHLTLDILILTCSSLNKIYIAILYGILIVCWISISGVEFVEVRELNKPEGAFSMRTSFNNLVGCNVRDMTFDLRSGEPYVTHCALPIVRFSVSWTMVLLYIAAIVYVAKEEKRSAKMPGRSKVRRHGRVEAPAADSPPGVYSGRVMRAVIREHDGEMPKTSLDQDDLKVDLERTFV